MSLRILRRVALGLLAVLAFAQASVVLAACSLERGSMAAMLEMPQGCASCESQADTAAAQSANRCVAHCTSDLQLSGSLVALVVHPVQAPVLILPRAEIYRAPRAVDEPSPPGGVPVRILLHSFLI
jgi:hypothetical protein